MKQKIDDSRLNKSPIAQIHNTNPLASHSVTGDSRLNLSLGQFFEAGITANKSRERLDKEDVVGFSIIGLPGVGKTTLIEETFEALSGRIKFAVLEAESDLEIDTTRLQMVGIPVLPVMATHWDQGHSEHTNSDRLYAKANYPERAAAARIAESIKQLDLTQFNAILFEETALSYSQPISPQWMHKKVATLTIANGEDVPRKHPWILADADCAVITKTDLLPHLNVDLGKLLDNIDEINPGLPVFDLSAQTGDGMEAWHQWITEQMAGSVAEENELLFAEKPVYVPFIG